MSLYAEVSGAAVSSYSWSFGSAADAGSIAGSGTYHTTFTWGTFTGAVRSDTITLTETATISGSGGSEQLVQTYPFKVTASGATAWLSAPTSASTWPSAPDGVGPDQLKGQAMVPAGPYAAVGQVDGSVQTGFSLPSYNPNVAPLGLVYSSAVADPTPVILITYTLDATKTLPSNVTALLTIANQGGTNVYTGSTIYYSPSLLNKGDNMQIAMQATGMTAATGRYNWQMSRPPITRRRPPQPTWAPSISSTAAPRRTTRPTTLSGWAGLWPTSNISDSFSNTPFLWG